MTTIRIENRAQLVYLLTEAAELEHEILCCYLFATFSLKESTAEGVTDDQMKAIRGWRRLINEVSVQEMLHLATACNLLTAVGGAPQLRRPNLPVSPRAYGATFPLGLAPFRMEVLDQFIAIEKPQELRPAVDVAGATGGAVKIGQLADIFSSEREYDTQGLLYRGIEDGFMYLAQKYGEDKLFIGPTTVQTTDPYFKLPDLIPVKDLESALAAIKVIVEQGEGASVDFPDSHYNKFMRVRNEYAAILEQDPDFKPAREVIENPYSMMPTDLADGSVAHVLDDPLSRDMANLFDGCYELMIQMLGRLFVHAEESDADLEAMAHVTEDMMFDVIVPLGSTLTTLPAGPSYPGKMAGPSFRLSRGASIPTKALGARTVFRERLQELVNYCRFMQLDKTTPPVLGKVREALSKFADRFAPLDAAS